MIFIRLVTIQPIEVLEILKKRGRYVCDIKRTAHRDYDEYSFRDVYDWLAAQIKYAEIALEIEPWRVVLSDNDAWNSVIGHCPVIYEEDDEKWNAEWERCMKIGKNAIEATWPKIFRSDVPYVQATFWELLKSDIVDVKVFTSKGYEQ